MRPCCGAFDETQARFAAQVELEEMPMALFTTHLALLSVAQPQHLSGSSGASIVVRSSSRLLLEVEGEGTDCSRWRWRWLGRWRFWSVRPVSRVDGKQLWREDDR